jgi:hypothetical protein
MNEEFINSLAWLLAAASKCLVGDCLGSELACAASACQSMATNDSALAAQYDF